MAKKEQLTQEKPSPTPVTEVIGAVIAAFLAVEAYTGKRGVTFHRARYEAWIQVCMVAGVHPDALTLALTRDFVRRTIAEHRLLLGEALEAMKDACRDRELPLTGHKHVYVDVRICEFVAWAIRTTAATQKESLDTLHAYHAAECAAQH